MGFLATWNHIAQARAQDLSEILDSNFIPATPEATELFVEKQKFFLCPLQQGPTY
jgi:hypothetical protein